MKTATKDAQRVGHRHDFCAAWEQDTPRGCRGTTGDSVSLPGGSHTHLFTCQAREGSLTNTVGDARPTDHGRHSHRATVCAPWGGHVTVWTQD